MADASTLQQILIKGANRDRLVIALAVARDRITTSPRKCCDASPAPRWFLGVKAHVTGAAQSRLLKWMDDPSEPLRGQNLG